MTIALTRVGNSKALIIPAKWLKKMKITDNTLLELSEKDDVITVTRTNAKRKEPVFPKVNLPELTQEELDDFRKGLSVITEEEIAADDRLAYILRR